MPTYLDNNATTALSPDALEAMMPFLKDRYQNVASVAGEAAGLRRVLSQARSRMASLLGLDDPEECVFTSGATESNNWAVEGVARQLEGAGHLVTTAIEHPSVTEAARRLEQQSGWSITVIEPDRDGVISVDAVVESLRSDTRLVSVMLANNETGIIQPVAQIARIVKSLAPGVTFHSDATQAVGKIAVSLSGDLDAVDLISLSAHKFHGPKGCGVLVIRGGTQLESLLVGGGQESGRRSGTVNLPAIVGCGAAALGAADWQAHHDRIRAMRDRFEARLTTQFSSAVIFGQDQHRLPNTSCFALPGHNGNSIADSLALMGIWVGTGSACSSGALHPPRSLLAMGVPHSLASSALRVSLSRYSLDSEVDELLVALKQQHGAGD
jgi:cysteine desulfurase